jgi:integrase
MKKAIGGGVYADKEGGFWIRPTINGKRTWEKIPSRFKAEALKIGTARIEEISNNQYGTLEPSDVTTIIVKFIGNGCPNSFLEARGDASQEAYRLRLASIDQFFGLKNAKDLRLSDCLDYAKWRMQRAQQGTGARSAEIDLQALSNVLNWAVSMNFIEVNPILRRPRFVKSSEVRHCRDCAPENIDQVHSVARRLFLDKRSAPLGWQLLFEALTGCRTSEILAMRYDAKPQEPGWYNEKALYVARLKHGINPWIPMTPPLWELIGQHSDWMLVQMGDSKSFFLSTDNVNPVSSGALTKRLESVCKELGFKKWTSHGLRSFYVTVRRSQGAPDAQIAGEIGDKTVSLISSTYGDRPPNWVGGDVLSFTPETPAWNDFEILK